MAEWTNYRKTFLDEPFIREATDDWPETIFEKTVRVVFLDDNERIFETNDYGLVHPIDVLKEINAENEINLSKCYVEGLDIGFKLSFVKGLDPVYIRHAEKAFFDKGVNFDNAEFPMGDLSFSNTLFTEGDVSFSSAKFGDGNISFNHTHFFKCNIRFNHCQFGKGKINFQGANLRIGNLDFSATRFNEGEIYFMELQTGGTILFHGASFNDSDITFVRSRINTILFDSISHFRSLDFTRCSFATIRFNECSFTDVIECNDLNTSVLEINECINNGTFNLRWEKHRLKSAINALIDQDKPYYELNNELYTESNRHLRAANTALLLKENFRKMGRYDDEDSAYVFYRNHQLLSSFWTHVSGKWYKRFNWLWAPIWYGLKWIVLGLISGYGTKPFNAIISMIVTWFGFGAFYFWRMEYCEECFKGPSIHEMSNLGKAAFHSAITFLTIGYGDIYPSSQALRIASGLEGFLGLFLMAVFTVSFMRKVLR